MRINLLLLFSCILLLGGSSFCATAMLSFNEVSIGDKGYGKTVFHGVRIEKFDICVMGKFANTKLENDLLLPGRAILIEITGDTVEYYGGISSGMSGSPIYVGEKIIGGLAATWKTNSKVQLALVTPIEDMLEILDYPSQGIGMNGCKDMHFDTPFEYDGTEYRGIYVCSNETGPADGYLRFKPVSSVVMTDMKITEAERILIGGTGIYNLVNPGSLLSVSLEQMPGAVLEEGASFGIQLVRGDFNVTALGTVTYLMNDKMVGLGHSMLKKGAVSYFLTTAYIYKTVPSQTIPYRLGVPLELTGSIIQDRDKAVLGLLKVYPSVVPVKIECDDLDLVRKKTYIFQIVADPEILPVYLRSSLTQALEQTSDRIGKGNVNTESVIRFHAGNSSEIRTLNVHWDYYDDADYTSKCVNSVVKVVNDLLENRFEKIKILDILIRTRVQLANQNHVLESMELSELVSGDFEVTVSMRPFKKERVQKKIKLEKKYFNSPGVYQFICDSEEKKNQDESDIENTTNVKDFTQFIRELESAVTESGVTFRIYLEENDKTSQIYSKKLDSRKFQVTGFVEKKVNIEGIDKDN